MIPWLVAGSGILVGVCGVLFGLWQRSIAAGLRAAAVRDATTLADAQRDRDRWKRATDEIQAALTATQDGLYADLRNCPDLRGMLEPRFRQLSAWRVRTIPEGGLPPAAPPAATDAG